MAIKYIRAYMRENDSIEFYRDSEDFLKHIENTYIKTGACLKFREINYIDDNNLVAEFVSIWKSEEETNSGLSDKKLTEEDFKRRTYNEDNKIVLLYITQEEVNI